MSAGTGGASILVALSLGAILSISACAPAMKPPDAPAPPLSSAQGRVHGRVTVAGTDQPYTGAVVQAMKLDTGAVRGSEPTGVDGQYQLAGLSYGYYEFSVSIDGVPRLVEGVLDLTPGESRVLDFSLPASSPMESTQDAARPGQGSPTGSGFERKPPFYRTTLGLGLILGAGGLLLLLAL